MNKKFEPSKASRAALAERTHWLKVEWLPEYAPELNEIERVWLVLKANHLAHQAFTDLDDRDRENHSVVTESNAERNLDSLGTREYLLGRRHCPDQNRRPWSAAAHGSGKPRG
ncbi:MAG: transposase [Rhodobacteraceae bacterium]|nr:transposase [Paracoccaceae bacterium]